MLRIILDTNVYGQLLEEQDFPRLEERLKKDQELLIYRYRPIRKEIRAIRKVTKTSRKLRNAPLTLYDDMTAGRFLEHSTRITGLAKKYHEHYQRKGGTRGGDTSIRVDFMIVACASLHGLDIICSSDRKTLMSKAARKAYQHVNHEESLRTPDLLGYEDLLQKIRNDIRACRQTQRP